jgi:hypothetical protein
MIQRDKDKGLIDIACRLKHETPKAYLLDVGEKDPIWLPKSQVEYFDDGKGGIVTLPYWLAKEKELI